MAKSQRASLSDIPSLTEEAAPAVLNEEPKKQKKERSDDDILKEYAEKATTMEVEKKAPEIYIFKLLGYEHVKQPPRYISLSNEMPIFDEEEQRLRTIRLVKGVGTIFADEQKDLQPAFIQRNKIDIVFNNGYLRVPATNTTLVEFLLNSDEYDGKKQRMRSRKPKFTLVNGSENDDADLIKTNTKSQAFQYALSAEVEDMLPHAKFLGINFIDDLGEKKTPKRIRIEYADKALQKPNHFMQTANSPYVKASFIVSECIERGIIDITSKKGYAVWKGTSSVISELPFGASVVETVTKLCLSATEEGRQVYAQLKRALAS